MEDQVFVRTEGRRIDVKNVLVPDFVYTVVKSEPVMSARRHL